ncbi:unnamed protein product [Amoebophrya sp. A120]|nr:unnamed protein product [Amoebophrya sp. A120]|eukprot:GSA120T00015970001.1
MMKRLPIAGPSPQRRRSRRREGPPLGSSTARNCKSILRTSAGCSTPLLLALLVGHRTNSFAVQGIRLVASTTAAEGLGSDSASAATAAGVQQVVELLKKLETENESATSEAEKQFAQEEQLLKHEVADTEQNLEELKTTLVELSALREKTTGDREAAKLALEKVGSEELGPLEQKKEEKKGQCQTELREFRTAFDKTEKSIKTIEKAKRQLISKMETMEKNEEKTEDAEEAADKMLMQEMVAEKKKMEDKKVLQEKQEVNARLEKEERFQKKMLLEEKSFSTSSSSPSTQQRPPSLFLQLAKAAASTSTNTEKAGVEVERASSTQLLREDLSNFSTVGLRGKEQLKEKSPTTSYSRILQLLTDMSDKLQEEKKQRLVAENERSHNCELQLSSMRTRVKNLKQQQADLEERIGKKETESAKFEQELEEKTVQFAKAKQASKQAKTTLRVRTREYEEEIKVKQEEAEALKEAVEVLAGTNSEKNPDGGQKASFLVSNAAEQSGARASASIIDVDSLFTSSSSDAGSSSTADSTSAATPDTEGEPPSTFLQTAASRTLTKAQQLQPSRAQQLPYLLQKAADVIFSADADTAQEQSESAPSDEGNKIRTSQSQVDEIVLGQSNKSSSNYNHFRRSPASSPVAFLAEKLRNTAKFLMKSKAGTQVNLSLRSGNDAFDSVKKMIADMIAKLEKEAAKNLKKEQFCTEQLGNNKEELASANQKQADLGIKKENLEASLEQMASKLESIAEKMKKISEDKDQMTALRTEKKNENEKETTNAKASGEAVARARVVLEKFYGTGEAVTSSSSSSSSSQESETVVSTKDKIFSLLEKLELDYSKQLLELTAGEENEKKMFEENVQSMKEEQAVLDSEKKNLKRSVANSNADLTELENELAATLEEIESCKKQKQELELQCEVVSNPEVAAKLEKEKKEKRAKDIENLKYVTENTCTHTR